MKMKPFMSGVIAGAVAGCAVKFLGDVLARRWAEYRKGVVREKASSPEVLDEIRDVVKHFYPKHTDYKVTFVEEMDVYVRISFTAYEPPEALTKIEPFFMGELRHRVGDPVDYCCFEIW